MKKGDLFMLGLNILYLIAIVFLFWKLSIAYQLHNTSEELGVRQVAVLDTYATSEKMLLTIDILGKFSAYEAFANFMEEGVLNPTSAPCGKYAGYLLWTNAEGSCIPESVEDSFSQAYREELVNVPNTPSYDFTFERDGGLHIDALTTGEIIIPIIAAKKARQAFAENLVNEYTKVEDDSLSPNKDAREGEIKTVLIHASGESAVESINEYTKGTISTHYFISRNGAISKFVNENEEALHCSGCSEQDTSIGVVLENDLDENYPTEQLDSLISKLVGVLKNNNLEVNSVKFGNNQNVGPNFGPQDAFLTRLAQKLAEEQINTDEDEETEEKSFTAFWPADSRVVTSCYGERNYLKGDGIHDGIDMPGNNQPVYAFAAGIVIEAHKENTGQLGKHIIIKHDNVITKYNHLSKVSVDKDDFVVGGAKIGLIGSTGQSTGAHLDFKIYNDANTGINEGDNPLCFFDDSTLKTLSFTGRNCAQFGYKDNQLTSSNPHLASQCGNIDKYREADDCTFSTGGGGVSSSLDSATSKTVDRLEKLPGVMEQIQKTSKEQGIDNKLVIAIIAVESQGEPDILNKYGFVGLGQFGVDATTDLVNVFKKPANPGCKCKSGTCYADEVSACAGDPRLEPLKMAEAIPIYLSRQINHRVLKKNGELRDDYVLFGVASYNQGAGTIQKMIDKAEAAGITNPTWEDVKEYGNEEVQNYVPNVMSKYSSLGGVSPSVGDQKCGDLGLTVRELGRYTFKPSFSIDTVDFLDAVDEIVDWTKLTYETCIGVEPQDTRECLEERKDLTNSIVSCEEIEKEHSYATKLMEAVTDCEDNQQDNCYCVFDTDSLDERDVSIRLYRNQPQVVLSTDEDFGQGEHKDVITKSEEFGQIPSEEPLVLYQEGPDDEPENTTVDLAITDKKRLRTWEKQEVTEGIEPDPFSKVSKSLSVDEFIMLKKDGEIVWTAASREDLENADINQCGVYKTTHQICWQSSTPTYKLSERKHVYPVVRYSLYLNDEIPPLFTEPITATMDPDVFDVFGLGTLADPLLGQDVTVKFEAPMDDVSYYKIICTSGLKTEEKKVLGREDDKVIDDMEVEITCKGGTSELGYFITVEAHDISGNEFPSIPVQVTKGADPTGQLP